LRRILRSIEILIVRLNLPKSNGSYLNGISFGQMSGYKSLGFLTFLVWLKSGAIVFEGWRGFWFEWYLEFKRAISLCTSTITLFPFSAIASAETERFEWAIAGAWPKPSKAMIRILAFCWEITMRGIDSSCSLLVHKYQSLSFRIQPFLLIYS
jgi:hypothetical protein